MSKFDKTSGAVRRPRAPQKKNGGGTLLGIFIGLVIGVTISFGVTLYLNKATLPFQNKYEGAPKTDSSAANGSQTPLPLPGKPGDKTAGERRFEFYGILEGKQPATTAPSAPTAPTAPSAPRTDPAPAASIAAESADKPEQKDALYLQVGAFKNAADADNLKARLALAGLEANVQEVKIPGKGAMHRVRLGPYRDVAEMNRTRELLAQAGVQGTLVRQ